MQEHDGQELAGFSKDVGDVVDVLEGGVAEWRGEGLCCCHEEETEVYCGAGEDAGGSVVRMCGARETEVDVPRQRGEEGLHGIED